MSEAEMFNPSSISLTTKAIEKIKVLVSEENNSELKLLLKRKDKQWK